MGSEMCIRDRTVSAWEIEFACEACTRADTQSCLETVESSRGRGGVKSVSKRGGNAARSKRVLWYISPHTYVIFVTPLFAGAAVGLLGDNCGVAVIGVLTCPHKFPGYPGARLPLGRSIMLAGIHALCRPWAAVEEVTCL